MRGYGKLNVDGTLSSANVQHEGFVSLDKFTKDENGNYYEYYQLEMVDGMYVPNMILLQKEYKKTKIQSFTNETETYIQKEVLKYDEANGTAFKDVHSCANYKDAMSYTHQPFCAAIWEWQITVWQKARTIQEDVVTQKRVEPSIKEFKNELPNFVGVE